MLPCRQRSSCGSCVPNHWRHSLLKVTAPQPSGNTPSGEDLLPAEPKHTPLPQSKHLGPQTQGSPAQLCPCTACSDVPFGTPPPKTSDPHGAPGALLLQLPNPDSQNDLEVTAVLLLPSRRRRSARPMLWRAACSSASHVSIHLARGPLRSCRQALVVWGLSHPAWSRGDLG